MPKKIPIEAWAARHYDPAPSAFVLRKWCRVGDIYPAPEKVGRDWYVAENARRLSASQPAGGGLVAQLEAAGA